MIIVRQYGSIPSERWWEFTCRNCGAELAAKTSDADKIYNSQWLWDLRFQCPLCRDETSVTQAKPGYRFPKGNTVDGFSETRSTTGNEYIDTNAM